ALAQLGVTHPGPMADQFMRQRAANAGDEEIPNGVLQYAAVAHFDNVVQVGRISAGPRLGKAHVARAPGSFGENLRGNLAVALPAYAVIGQEAVEFRLIHGLPAQQINGRLTDKLDGRRIDGVRHGFLAYYGSREVYQEVHF